MQYVCWCTIVVVTGTSYSSTAPPQKVLWKKTPGRQMLNFLCLQGSYNENPMILFWVLEISSPEIVCAKDAQRLWASHSGMLLPLIPIQTSLSLQYNQLLGTCCHSRTTYGSSPLYLDGIMAHCALMSVRALCSCGFDILGHWVLAVQ